MIISEHQFESVSSERSIYDLENPWRHQSIEGILELANAKHLNGNVKVIDHGNGYTTILPGDEDSR